MARNPRSPEGGNGASVPGDPPKVYLPQPAASPAYDAYADPAAAHGWQNAYDETAELPPVVEGGPMPGSEGAPHRPGAAERRSHRAPGRRARRSGPRVSRLAVAGGALGAVSAVALIASFAFSGSSPDGTGEKRDRTGPTAEDPAAPPGAAPSISPSVKDGSTAGAGSGATEPGDEGTSGEPSATPSADASTTSTPALPTATATSAPAPGQAGQGNSGDRPGKGLGLTKRPK